MEILSIAPGSAYMMSQTSTSTAVPETIGDIAVIPLKGAIRGSVSILDLLEGGSGMTGGQVANAIISAADDDSISKIKIPTDSPGGEPGPSDQIRAAVKYATSKKPVISEVTGMACSGAYLAISPSTEIIAGPMDVLGSISVLVQIRDTTALEESVGIKTHVFRTGKHKAAGIDGLTEEQAEQIEKVAMGLHGEFVSSVADGRGLPLKAVEKLADGREFLGREALALGLITKLKGDKSMSKQNEGAPADGAEQGILTRIWNAVSKQEAKIEAIGASNQASMEALNKKLEASEAKTAKLEAKAHVKTLMAGCSPIIDTKKHRAALLAVKGIEIDGQPADEVLYGMLNAAAPTPDMGEADAGDDGDQSIRSRHNESDLAQLQKLGIDRAEVTRLEVKYPGRIN